jgi:hypothetical protein
LTLLPWWKGEEIVLRNKVFVLIILSSMILGACEKPKAQSTKKSSLGDYVWIDSNLNGLQDEGEVGLKGVKVSLFEHAVPDGGYYELEETETDANGKYFFTDISAGDYSLEFKVPKDMYVFTIQDRGSDDFIDSDAEISVLPGDENVNYGETTIFKVDGGEHLQWDAGVVLLIDGVATATPPGYKPPPPEVPTNPDLDSSAEVLRAFLKSIDDEDRTTLDQQSESLLGRGNTVENTPKDQQKTAIGHTDVINRILLHIMMTPIAVDRWFMSTDFPCGLGDYGFTVCGTGTFTAGRSVVVIAAFDGEVPLEDPTNMYQYGIVFDRDGDPTNNYQASPAFQGDFFDGTDLWYELAYDPVQGWMLIATDVIAGFAQKSSGARAIISGNSITLIIPEAELSSDTLLYRVTAFRHTGDFGFGSGDWDGDVDPPVGEPLLEMSDLAFEVEE